MDDSENALKLLCCTCLCRERKLYQLCRIADGVNNLYSLLSYDIEAYKEGFYKDTADLHICWECKAMMSRISSFRRQACSVQRQLTDIVDGKTDINHLKTCLSKLKSTTKHNYDVTISYSNDTDVDNFVDCGPAGDGDDNNDDENDDDVPLSELLVSDGEKHEGLILPSKAKVKRKNKMKASKTNLSCFRHSEHFTITQMSYEDMIASRERDRKILFKDALHKCESCVEVFKTDIALERHVEDFHTKKENHSQCTICLSFTPEDALQSHKQSHFTTYICNLCQYIANSMEDAKKHIKENHYGKKDKKLSVRSKLKERKKVATDENNSLGFKCPECNKYFDTKNKRWKHIQRYHREGFACDKCGKRFAFRSNLNRHQRIHESPPPRTPCPTCNKLVRCDLFKVHERIHAARETRVCAACNKTFVSRASYEHHLKYTRAHAQGDILKHKCAECDKGYRSRAELLDHVNYQHRGKTRHQCPQCGKALATRRCVTRHVRRAHRGIKEGERNKICQQCGKAFRDKKGLVEHERTHFGARPLCCDMCTRTFRQAAALHTHRRRVHHAHPRHCARLLDVG